MTLVSFASSPLSSGLSSGWDCSSSSASSSCLTSSKASVVLSFARPGQQRLDRKVERGQAAVLQFRGQGDRALEDAVERVLGVADGLRPLQQEGHAVEPVLDLEFMARQIIAVLQGDLVVVLNILEDRRAAGQDDRRQQPHADRTVEELEQLLAEAVLFGSGRGRWRRRRYLCFDGLADGMAIVLFGGDTLQFIVGQHVDGLILHEGVEVGRRHGAVEIAEGALLLHFLGRIQQARSSPRDRARWRG